MAPPITGLALGGVAGLALANVRNSATTHSDGQTAEDRRISTLTGGTLKSTDTQSSNEGRTIVSEFRDMYSNGIITP